MWRSEALVETDRPARYLSQLCKHFAHKADVELAGDRGSIGYGYGTCTLEATASGLRMWAEAADEEALSRVESVAGRHLERFGARDELTVSWSRVSAT